MTTEEQVKALRDKIETKRVGLNKYLANGEFDKDWYKHGLEVQEASFRGFINELDKILAGNR